MTYSLRACASWHCIELYLVDRRGHNTMLLVLTPRQSKFTVLILLLLLLHLGLLLHLRLLLELLAGWRHLLKLLHLNIIAGEL
jgi:hypothetical protein